MTPKRLVDLADRLEEHLLLRLGQAPEVRNGSGGALELRPV
jgi:hypothetical protein